MTGPERGVHSQRFRDLKWLGAFCSANTVQALCETAAYTVDLDTGALFQRGGQDNS